MIYGADISNHQGGHDLWPLVDAGHRFVILKATEGATYRDAFMAAWRDQGHAAGLFVGLYHFARANDPLLEADNFFGAIGSLGPNEFAVCDWEDGASSEQVQAWLEAVEARSGRRPVLYSYGPYLAARPTANLTRWPLWIAAYGPNDGAEHPPASTDRWAPFEAGPGTAPFEGRTIMWQFTSDGTVPNWDGRLDLNRFDGTEADLAALCGGTTPAPSPGPGRVVTNGWREIVSYGRWRRPDALAYPTPAQSYAGTHAAGSWHFRDSDYPEPPYPDGTDGCACDFGDANSDPRVAFDLFRPFAVPGGPVPELIFEHVIVKDGVEGYYAPNDHLDHCHVAVSPSAHLPSDPAPPPVPHPEAIKEDPMFMFGIPSTPDRPDGGIWLAWAGKRWHLSSMAQVDELKSKGVPFLEQWPIGEFIPEGKAEEAP